jgi:hypothetical protein
MCLNMWVCCWPINVVVVLWLCCRDDVVERAEADQPGDVAVVPERQPGGHHHVPDPGPPQLLAAHQPLCLLLKTAAAEETEEDNTMMMVVCCSSQRFGVAKVHTAGKPYKRRFSLAAGALPVLV